MAHKTFSQEQMKFERYKTLITYFNNINKNLNNLNKSINFIIKKRYLEKRLTLGSNLLITDKSLYDEIGRHARLKILSAKGPGSSPGVGTN